MITIKGNILAVKNGFICHQVNCRGMLDSKLSESIANVWPRLLTDYIQAFRTGKLELGQVIFTTINLNRLHIATLCAEEDSGAYMRKLSYPALGSCLQKVEDWYKMVGLKKLPVYIPWKIGCNSSGGDWHVVSEIIKREISNAIVVKL